LTLAADIPAVALLELTPRVRGPHAQTLYMIGHSTPTTTPIETAALRDFDPAYRIVPLTVEIGAAGAIG